MRRSWILFAVWLLACLLLPGCSRDDGKAAANKGLDRPQPEKKKA